MGAYIIDIIEYNNVCVILFSTYHSLNYTTALCCLSNTLFQNMLSVQSICIYFSHFQYITFMCCELVIYYRARKVRRNSPHTVYISQKAQHRPVRQLHVVLP